MRESLIERYVCRWAKARGVDNIKLSLGRGGMGTSGWPDRLFLVKGGKPLIIEFKATGEIPTALQSARINQLRKLGYDVHVCDSREKAIYLIGVRL